MIIVCDSCGTRFHLAEGRVGPKGAKVRCSNCHHSFQVTPPNREAAERPKQSPVERPPGAEHSPRPAGPGRAPGAGAAARKVLGDPDLDNPQFLFDGSGEADAPTADTAKPRDVPISAGESTAPVAPLGLDADDTPPSKRAPTPFMGVDPEAAARQHAASHPAEPAVPPRESLFDFGRDDNYEETPMPGREPVLTAPAEPAPAAFVPAGEPEADTLAKLAGGEVDEAIARWDAPVAATPRTRRVEVLRPARPAAPPVRSAPRRVERIAPVPDDSLATASADPSGSPVWLDVAVALVALVLAVSLARASLRQAGASFGPLEVQALGWTASEIRARPARDAAGDPAIEVTGALRGPASPFPRVRVSSVDGAGRPLGGAAEARVEASGRFLAVLEEPPAAASAFRVDLAEPLAPPPPPAPTTTAAPAPLPDPAQRLTDGAPEAAPAAPAP
jgi:predicted Zn finger-like uncharacterized protein